LQRQVARPTSRAHGHHHPCPSESDPRSRRHDSDVGGGPGGESSSFSRFELSTTPILSVTRSRQAQGRPAAIPGGAGGEDRRPADRSLEARAPRRDMNEGSAQGGRGDGGSLDIVAGFPVRPPCTSASSRRRRGHHPSRACRPRPSSRPAPHPRTCNAPRRRSLVSRTPASASAFVILRVVFSRPM
jgi:hypothetical protein